MRVLEVKNVEDETFPSMIAQEQWKASEDTITIPKAALLGKFFFKQTKNLTLTLFLHETQLWYGQNMGYY